MLQYEKTASGPGSYCLHNTAVIYCLGLCKLTNTATWILHNVEGCLKFDFPVSLESLQSSSRHQQTKQLSTYPLLSHFCHVEHCLSGFTG